MTDAVDRQARAEAADRLLRDPMLVEALDAMEAALLEKIVEAPARDDEGRRYAAFAIQAARKFRRHLASVIAGGKTAAINAANDIARDAPARKRT
jgi:hypothetical protein